MRLKPSEYGYTITLSPEVDLEISNNCVGEQIEIIF